MNFIDNLESGKVLELSILCEFSVENDFFYLISPTQIQYASGTIWIVHSSIKSYRLRLQSHTTFDAVRIVYFTN